MNQFEQYFLMDESSVVDYVRAKAEQLKTSLFAGSRDNGQELPLTAKEIGDGNLNYVYRVGDGKKSVIVKQAGPMARLSSGKEISRDRNRIESEILMLQWELAPGSVPEIYLYDEIMCCCVMEDLADYEIMRSGLLEGKVYPEFPGHIAEFLVNMLMKTSDLSKDHKKKKEWVKAFINPDLCEISERLVFDEAMLNLTGKNHVEPENEALVRTRIYENKELIAEAAKLKYHFMNDAQVLLHGDLHTGSIFVKKDSTKIFDPEFAFYGPAGYDLGNVAAHLLIAAQRMNADGNEEAETWIRTAVSEVISHYIDCYEKQYSECAGDALSKQEGFKEWYLEEILKDTAGYAGMEILRRCIGVARTKDVQGIADPEKRAEAERKLIETGIELVMQRERYFSRQSSEIK